MRFLIAMLLLCLPAQAQIDKDYQDLVLSLYKVTMIEPSGSRHVLFTAPGCAGCVFQKRETKELKKQHKDIEFHEVNCLEDHNSQYLCMGLKIKTVPVNIGYKDGEQVFRVEKPLTKRSFQAYMRTLK